MQGQLTRPLAAWTWQGLQAGDRKGNWLGRDYKHHTMFSFRRFGVSFPGLEADEPWSGSVLIRSQTPVLLPGFARMARVTIMMSIVDYTEGWHCRTHSEVPQGLLGSAAPSCHSTKWGRKALHAPALAHTAFQGRYILHKVPNLATAVCLSNPALSFKV